MSDTLEDMIYRRTLPCGTIQVVRDRDDVLLNDLFDIAERRNPKCALLFVSKVLGRHISVPPSVMRQVYRQLASQFPSTPTGPALFIGMAETVTGLGAGVLDEVRHRHRESVYLTSTRHPVDGTLLCEFKEEHSHTTDHLTYLPDDEEKRHRVTNARTLVLIDDEATTGNTFINLLSALRSTDKLQHIEQVIAATLTDWSGKALSKHSTLPVTSVSLVSSEWGWTPLPGAPVPDMSKTNVASRGKRDIQGKQSRGQPGMLAPAADFGHKVSAHKGERILVLGIGEFVWEPFLLAERLEAAGAQVPYGSTTRSPIAVGYAIESAISSTDNYGLGVPNFIYDVAHQQFDRILVCAETPAGSIDAQFLEALTEIAAAMEIVTYE